jgi:Fic family protein
MPGYVWRPIEPLGNAENRIELGAMRPLYENWHAARKRIQESSQAQLADFNRKLIRRLSIETGILERLYDLDRGTTEVLVAHGFAEELITQSNTNIEPSRLIDLLRDQEAGIQLLIDCVAGNRAVTKGLIHELHAILTHHQETTTAVDQFGTRLDIPLVKGKYKQQPNNPRRAEGSIHEYCPPIHVESEMEQLLGWLTDYQEEDPVVVAAWAHHRFTQIHPYQDGNGRVARALTTLILLRSDLLPLVIDRDLRVEYLDALESADLGDLAPLAGMFARLESDAILRALSVDSDEEMTNQASLTSAVITSLQDKFSKRRLQKRTTLRHVNEVAIQLREQAKLLLRNSFDEIKKTVDAGFGKAESFVTDGGTDQGNGHWYKFEVASSARAAGKFANFAENHYFIKASIRAETERLVFIISFHHVGRELTGIMEATAFSLQESYEDSDDRKSVSGKFSLCSLEPFVYTHQTDVTKIADAFARWLDGSLALALKEYGDRL